MDEGKHEVLWARLRKSCSLFVDVIMLKSKWQFPRERTKGCGYGICYTFVSSIPISTKITLITFSLVGVVGVRQVY